MRLAPLGDSAVVITLGERVDPETTARVQAVAAEIRRHAPPGVLDVVPAFATVAVFLDGARAAGFDGLISRIEELAVQAEAAAPASARVIEIPVAYGAEFGPDLAGVAAHTGLPADEVLALHSGTEYRVHAIGFSPGFPYLGGLPAALATPRRATPRARVPAGSVGIGGAQTGVYSLETPGGWNLIGRTPWRLFEARRSEPALLRAGDRVRFRRIGEEEFGAIAAELRASTVAGRGDAEGERGCPGIGPAAGIEVLRAGMFTTLQDLGRPGHRAAGVPLGGAADPLALRMVNALVGNPDEAAGLEFTLIGPELRFGHDTVVAFGGGDFDGLPRWQPVRIPAGTVLKLGRARRGCRGYLAVAGGIDVPPVLGSRGTYVRAALGGLDGRILRDGDVLAVPTLRRRTGRHWHVDERILPAYSPAATVRVVVGAHANQIAGDWTGETFRVSAHSDRMGVRLTGSPLSRSVEPDLLSMPVVPGTIQVPPDGQPIVLLADAQTIGGYPQLGHVISVDLPLVAQLAPGDTLRFQQVSLAEARELHSARERALAWLREGLAQKLA